MGKTKKCKLAEALYVPDLTFSLISIVKASDVIRKTVLTNEGCESLDVDRKVVATGRRIGKLYHLNCRQKQQSASQGDTKSLTRSWSNYGTDDAVISECKV